MIKLRSAVLTALALSMALSASAHAAVIVTKTSQLNTGFTVSSNDLLQTSLASTIGTGMFSREGEIGIAAFNNGVYGNQGNQGNGGQAATADNNNSLLFNFNAANGNGYNISSIESYAGWDNYRGGQSYNVFYATALAPSNFVLLASVFTDPYGGGNNNTRATIVGSDGFLAKGVTSLRFDFKGDLTLGYAGYREIDVKGTAASAAVPEPGSLALLGLGILGFAAARRRQQA